MDGGFEVLSHFPIPVIWEIICRYLSSSIHAADMVLMESLEGDADVLGLFV